MIKALMLILNPIGTWERAATTQRRWGWVFLGHVVPLLVLATAAECYGLVHWGKPRGEIAHIKIFSRTEAITYGVGQLLLSIVMVFLAAKLIKSLGETFHSRNTFRQAFTVAAYGLSPVFLSRVFDAFPGVSPWLTWGIGMVFSIATLYHGLPRVMLPDPPHAFGFYISTTFLLLILTGLARFLTVWYLQGKFIKLDNFIANLIGT